MNIAFTFPGQGSQFVGMGKDLAAAYPAAAAASLPKSTTRSAKSCPRFMWDGPAERLTLTENAQPALMAVSLAAMRVLTAEKGWDLRAARFVAGHSLGEYSALAAAGTLTVADAARLLRIRGKAMQEAVPVGQGAMAALLGVDLDIAAKIVAEAASTTGLVCQVANDNAPGQVVISGAKQGRRGSHADRQGLRAAPRHSAAGQRAVPLRPDAARGRPHGRGAQRRRSSPPPPCR